MSTATRRYTYEDLLDTPDDGNRYEIIDGALIVSAAPVLKHQWMLFLLSLRFGNYVTSQRLGRIFFALVDVLFPSGDTVEPDLSFISKERMHIAQGARVVGAPDALLEVLSSSTRDRDLGRKLEIYQMFGVKEYWIADPDTPALMLMVRDESGQFRSVPPVNGALHSIALPGFEIDLAELFAEFNAE